MKKIKMLFLVLVCLLVLPLGVFAEGEDEETVSNETSKKVNVYFFRGDGCPHCAEAEEWFESINEELGDKYELKDYEVWNNQDNSELMQKVAAARQESEEATGVPYIIIGDKSWIGFDQSYTGEIKEQINTVYEQEVSQRYDIMSYIDSGSSDDKEKTKSSGSDILAIVLIVIVGAGTGFGIYKARSLNA